MVNDESTLKGEKYNNVKFKKTTHDFENLKVTENEEKGCDLRGLVLRR